MATLPGNLALTSIADGSLIVAADHRNNYAAIQAEANALLTILAGGTAGQVFTSSGTTTVGWAAPTTATRYAKTTSKTVNTTVAATDLLNGEITIAAGAMGTTGLCRLTAWGDWKQNAGGTAAPPRLQLVLGGTTLLDTGTSGLGADVATRFGWEVNATILNLGAANSQTSKLAFRGGMNVSGLPGNTFTTGVGNYTGVSNVAFSILDAVGTNASTALDTATSKTLVLNVINGSANANYETKLFGAVVEIV